MKSFLAFVRFLSMCTLCAVFAGLFLVLSGFCWRTHEWGYLVGAATALWFIYITHDSASLLYELSK